MSGLTAMLTAAELLSNNSEPASFKRRLVFTALAGEPWQNMGSKRLLWELSTGENSTRGLQLSKIDQVKAYFDFVQLKSLLSHHLLRQFNYCTVPT